MKQVILVNMDLKMGKGKIAVQVAHASLLAAERCRIYYPEIFEQWLSEGAKKIALRSNLAEMLEIQKEAERRGIPFALIQDRGLTQVAPGSTTALALGPWPDDEIDQLTGHLKLL